MQSCLQNITTVRYLLDLYELKFEIEIVHDLSCHPIVNLFVAVFDGTAFAFFALFSCSVIVWYVIIPDIFATTKLQISISQSISHFKAEDPRVCELLIVKDL